MPRPRRFAPLDPAKQVSSDPRPVLKGIVFDVDGTLCLPQNYMFAEMRAALGITKATDILDHIYSLPEPEQTAAQEKVRTIERTAMADQQPQEGTRNIPKAICTRNFDAPVAHLLTTFLPSHTFSPIITRAFRPPKPHPAGILHIARTWATKPPNSSTSATSRSYDDPHQVGEPSPLAVPGISITNSGAVDAIAAATACPSAEAALETGIKSSAEELEVDASNLIMVGDSIDDMTAGHLAGAATVLLVNEVNAHLTEHAHTDFAVRRLDELIEVLERGFEGRCEDVSVEGAA